MNRNNGRSDLRLHLFDLAAELSDLCGRDNINLARGPREVPGNLISLFVLPLPDDRTQQVGLELQIVPAALPADVEDEILDGMREAAKELLDDSNPDVREGAQDSLKRLALPRLAPDDIEGHLFSLSSLRTRRLRLSEATNRQGKTRFEELAPESEFMLEYCGRNSATAAAVQRK